MGTIVDLTGQRFGRWTVLHKAHSRYKSRATMWHCRCDCGNEQDISRSNLISGKSKSCGCYRDEKMHELDFTKRKYDDYENITHKLCPLCKEFKTIDSFSLKTKNLDGYSEYCKDCTKYNLRRRYSHYKRGAKVRNLAFDISESEFDFITKQPCTYCGKYAFSYQGVEINGIDRIDSNIGYINSNIVPCCEMCNRMKLDYTKTEWINQMKLILQHLEAQQ